MPVRLNLAVDRRVRVRHSRRGHSPRARRTTCSDPELLTVLGGDCAILALHILERVKVVRGPWSTRCHSDRRALCGGRSVRKSHGCLSGGLSYISLHSRAKPKYDCSTRASNIAWPSSETSPRFATASVYIRPPQCRGFRSAGPSSLSHWTVPFFGTRRPPKPTDRIPYAIRPRWLSQAAPIRGWQLSGLHHLTR